MSKIIGNPTKGLIAIPLLILLFACNGGTGVPLKSPAPADSSSVTKEVASAGTKDSCKLDIKQFLSWYKSHIEELGAIQFFNLPAGAENTTNGYRVNFDNVNKYLAFLRASGFFSEAYLANRLAKFKATDAALLKSHQADGPVEGFDADPFLFTQEPEAVLQNIDALKTKQVTPGSIMLYAMENNLLFTLAKAGNRCVIENISFIVKGQ